MGQVPPESGSGGGGPAAKHWLVPDAPRCSCTTTSSSATSGFSHRPLPNSADWRQRTPSTSLELDLDAAEAVVADRTTASRRCRGSRPWRVTSPSSSTRRFNADQVRQTIRQAASATLVRVREFDRYQGKGIPEGKVSLSLRLTFRSPDRTLTDAEVQNAMDGVLAALRDRHGAVQR